MPDNTPTTSPPSDDFVTAFRLAFRREGSQVNCYIASPDSMVDARLISTMPERVLSADKTIWEDWQALMQRVIRVIAKEVLNADVAEFEVRPAPESERSGNG